jgi:hypothetical protein
MAERPVRLVYTTLYVSPSPVAGWLYADIGSTAWTSVVMCHDL